MLTGVQPTEAPSTPGQFQRRAVILHLHGSGVGCCDGPAVGPSASQKPRATAAGCRSNALRDGIPGTGKTVPLGNPQFKARGGGARRGVGLWNERA